MMKKIIIALVLLIPGILVPTPANAAPVLTGKTTGSSTNDVAAYSTASVSFAASRLVLIAFDCSDSVAPGVPTVTGAGLTWTQVATNPYDNAGSVLRRLSVYQAVTTGAASGAITMTFPQAQTGCTWSVSEVSGVDLATPIVDATNGTGTGTAMSVTNAMAQDNMAFGAFGLDIAGNISPGSGFTEIHEPTARSSPAGDMQTERRVAPAGGLTITNATTSGSTIWGGIAVEIDGNLAPPPLTAPVLSASGTDHDSTDLAWTDAGAETGYEVFQSTDNIQFTSLGTKGANVLTHQATGLSAETQYWFKVTATDGTQTVTSNIVTVTTTEAPITAPVLTLGDVRETEADLSWTDAGPEDGYDVLLSTDDLNYTVAATVGADVLAHTLTGLTGSTEYFAKVRATTTGGQAQTSNTVTFTTDEPPPPGCVGVDVVAPASIQAAIDANPTGTTFCLSGTFTGQFDIRPKAGDTFVGPASIVGPNDVPERFVDEPDDRGMQLKSQAPDVTLIDLDVSGFEQGIGCWIGTEVIGGRYHHNTENGIGCGLQAEGGVTVTGAEIDNNGSLEFQGHSSSGFKIARSAGSTIRDVHAHHNIGMGLWCDIDCEGPDLFEDNFTEFNTEDGIQYEISFGPVTIQNNIVTNNNTSLRGAHGGILLNSSCPASAVGSCLVTENTVLDNGLTDIRIRDDGRPYGVPFEIAVTNNDVSETPVGCTLGGVTCTGNS